MVAIVSGNSLGLGQTSLATLGQHGLIGNAAHGRNGQGAYVNVATGNLVVQQQDDYLVAAGADIATVRTYNSLGATDDADNWVVSLARPPLQLAGAVNTMGSTVTRTAEDGAVAVYTFDGTSYVSREGDGAYDTISVAGGRYTWCDGSTNATELYEGPGALLLRASRDATGQGFTYAYESGRLARASAENGESTFFDYDLLGRLEQVRTGPSSSNTRSAVRYGYDTLHRLVSVQVDLTPDNAADAASYRTEYTYDGASKRVASIAQSDQTLLRIAYVQIGADHRVADITDALGRTTSFTYLPATSTASARTMVVDPLGHVTRYDHDAEGQLVGITPPAGAGGAIAFAYQDGNVVSVTDGGGVTRFGYDPRGNRILEIDAVGNRTTRTFNGQDQVVAETVAGATTRHVYDTATGKLLRFSISAEGRVTEHRYVDGREVATLAYTQDRYAAVDADEAKLQAWVAESLPATNTTRTSSTIAAMTYDARGQLASVTRAGVTETLQYDQRGLLLQRSSAAGTTRYVHDGLGRLLASTRGGEVTTTEYLDAAGMVKTTLANGLVRTQVHDRSGALVAQTNAAGTAGETRYAYDAAGRLRMTQDPTQVRSWILYDAAGRKSADIDGNGTMTEYVYDAQGLLAYQTTYAAAAKLEALSSGGQPNLLAGVADVRPASSEGDARQWFSYDAAGRLVRQAGSTDTAAQVAVTDFTYDAASRLVSTTAYAARVTAPAEPLGPIPNPTATPAQDRVTRYFHDADGRRTGTLDAEGYLTETIYDAAGQPIRQVAYAKAVAPNLRGQATLAGLAVQKDADADVSTSQRYDADGRLVAQVDAGGYLTTTEYDAAGNVTKTTRHAGVDASGKGAGAARTTTRTYDAVGRLASVQDADGLLTTYGYDIAGRLVSTVRGAPGAANSARSALARYDLQGRVTAELSGEGAALLSPTLTPAQVDAIWQAHGTSHTYDAASRRLSTTDALGQRTLFFYDADGALTHTVNPLGEVHEKRYDAQGRLVEQIEYAGRVATTGLTGGIDPAELQARLAAIAGGGDARTRYTYTASGAVATQTDALGGKSEHGYDAFGDRTSTTAPAVAREVYSFDRRGLRTATQRESTTLSTVYDAFGRAAETVDANGNRRRFVHDPLGRQVTVIDPLGSTRSTTYDAFDRVLTQTNALGKVTRYAYDATTRSVTVTTPEGVESSSARNVFGETSRVTDGNENVTDYRYDRDGRLLETTTGLGASSNAYDRAGRLVATTDARGVQVSYRYDAAGRVVQRTEDPSGLALATTYQYDGRGQRISVTDPNGVVTTTAFDKGGRVVTQVVDAAGLKLKTTYTHDAAGRVLTVTSPGGSVTQYTYDALGRRTREVVDPGGLALERKWTYDANGNAVTSTDARGYVTRYAYDAGDRLVHTVDPLGYLRSSRYDKEGRVDLTKAYAVPIAAKAGALTVADIAALYQRDPDHDLCEYRLYDDDNRLFATVDGAGGVTRYWYDGNGNVRARKAYAKPIDMGAWNDRTQLPDYDTDASRDSLQVTVYDALGRAAYVMDSGSVVAQKWDANGNLVERTAYAAPFTPRPEATLDEMKGALAGIADAARDRRERFVYDAANRLTWSVDGVGAVTRRYYDANGNLVRQVAYADTVGASSSATSVQAGSADRVSSMAYDGANRLVFQVDAEGAVTQHWFDGDGRVIRTTAYATLLSRAPSLGASASAIEASLKEDDTADRHTRYAYDEAGRRVYEVGPMGAVTRTEYNATGDVTARTRYDDPISTRTRSTPAAIVEALGKNTAGARETFSYNAAGQVTRHVDAGGGTESYTRDALGRKLGYVNQEGATWTYTYDAEGRMVSEKSPKVYVGSVVRDPVTGQLAGGETDFDHVLTRFVYDALGNLVQRTEAAGRPEERITRYRYDGAGRQVRVDLPDVWAYDPSEDVLVKNGATSVAKRAEDVARDVHTLTVYDALGNAVAGRDVGGGISQKAYDRMGRLAYEVDALGYVTGYQRNAFGEVVRLVRYGASIGIPASVASAGDAATLDEVTAALAKDSHDHSADRTLLSAYDRAGRLVETTEASVYVYQHSLGAEGQGAYASRTTRQVHDAFGQVVQVVVPRGVGGSTATTTRYYDRAGRETATVDAMGYLTLRSFDAAGNLLKVTEFANALAKGWTVADYGDKPATSQDDRRTAFTYDALGRKTSETRLGVEYSSQGNGKSARGDLTTAYAYDGLGQQTAVKDAAGAVTYTYYDALGRVQAVAAPRRDVEGAQNLIPLTLYKRDAHGNVVCTVEYAQGAAVANASGYDTQSHRDDRRSYALHDTHGRVIESADAAGHSRFFSYDLHGNVTKQWEGVTAADDVTRTVFQVNVYDKLGRVVQAVTPESLWVYASKAITPVAQADAGLVTVATRYNAFGEITRQGEVFHDYDAAGRLWRTNGDDGVVRIHLYDLQGNLTSEIRSSGSGRADEDLTAVASAAAADRLRYARRTDMTYDALGRVTAREEGARREKQGGVTVDRQELVVGDITTATYAATGEDAVKWLKPNAVELNWSNLSGLGTGDVKVTIEYLSKEKEFSMVQTDEGYSTVVKYKIGGVARKYSSEAFNSYTAANGVTLKWDEEARGLAEGGIEEITRVIVYKKDNTGVWRTVMDQAPGYAGNVIDMATPPNPDASIALELRVAGTTGDAGWFTVGTRDFGMARRFDADALGPGKYEYRVQVKTPGEDWHLTSEGVITLTAPPLNTISAGMAYGKPAAGTFSWKAPAAQVGQDFRYRLADGTGIWRSLDIVTDKAGLQVVDTRSLADGAYEFELLWSRTDFAVPISHATGTFTVGKKPVGAIDSKPGKTAISTTEGGKIAQAAEQDGESRWLRPVVYQNTDRWGNVVAITDPRSKAWKTTYAFNASNQLVRQTTPDPAGSLGAVTTTMFYDAMGRQAAIEDGRGFVNGQVWDNGGNLVQEIHADGGVVRHVYNAFGNRVSTKDAEENVRTFTYDDMGRMTGAMRGTARDYSVGKDNQTLSDTRREIWERWSYDELGQQTAHTNGNGETTRFTYDLRGNLVESRKPLGQATRYAYDLYGRKVAEVDANGSYATWKYDAFGQLRAHKDLGGGDWTYTYDNARQLVKLASTDRAQSILYEYDAAGQATRIEDTANTKVTYYGYDLAGRKVREKLVQRSVTYQDNFLSYDAQGRLRDVADGRVHIEMDYDAAGNRTRIGTRVNYQGVTKEVTDSTERYFRYDEMNRQTLVDGNADGDITAEQGHKIAYDKNGNRIADVSYGNRIATTENVIDGYDENGVVIYSSKTVTFRKSFGKSTETYRYDNLNRLVGVTRDGIQVDVRRYDGADRVIRSGPFNVLAGYMAALNEGVDPAEAHSQDVRINRYDQNGQLLHQRTRSSDGKTLKSDTSWDPTEKTADLAGYVADGYDAAGNVLGYVVRSYTGGGATEFTTRLARFEGYQASVTSGRSSETDAGSVTHTYDANGFLVGVTDQTQPDNNRVIVNDAQGRALYVKQEGHIRRQLIVDGEVMGSYGAAVDPLDPSSGKQNTPNFANHADFNFGYARVSASHPSASPGAYQVQAGETLQSIAQAAYGESALWYRIAEANGKMSSTDLRVGETLNIPNRVGTVGNSDTTFRPYDPSRLVGDTTPNLPSPSNGGGCGAVGQVLMVVVAAAVTVALGPMMTSLLSSQIAGMAAAAAAGSVASQVVGMATGTIDKFQWKGVALAAVSGGVTHGVDVGGGAFVNGAIRSVVTQGIGIVTGMQRSFSWRAVAASAVGAQVGAEAGIALRDADLGLGDWNAFASRSVAAFAAGSAAAALRGGRVSVVQVAADAFGNALGQSVAKQVNSPSMTDTGSSGSGIRVKGLQGTRVSDGAYTGASQGNSTGGGGATELYLNHEQEARLNSGETMSDVYAAEVDGVTAKLGLQAKSRFGPSATARSMGASVAPTAEIQRVYNAMGDYTGVDATVESSPAFSGYGMQMRKVAGFFGDLAIGGVKGIDNLIPETLALGYRMVGYSLVATPVNWFNADAGDRLFAQYERVTGRIFDYDNPIQELGGISAQLAGPGLAKGLSAGAMRLSSALSSEKRVVSTADAASEYATFRANFVGPTFGKSGFISTSELGDASFLRYQSYVTDAYDVARAQEARGLLPGNRNTRIGSFVDRDSATRYGAWLDSESIPDGMVRMNRWLRDPAGTGLYVRPDIRIPGASLSLDATVGLKWSTDTQIIRFSSFSGGDRITIVRPQQLGGSYSIWPR